MSSGPRQYDLTDCDREPIHALGHIQSFGALLAVNTDWSLAYYSANASEVLGIEDKGAAGKPLSAGFDMRSLLRPAAVTRLEQSIAQIDDYNVVERVFDLELLEGQIFDCTVHQQRGLIMIDIEPVVTETSLSSPLDLLRPLTMELETADDLAEICKIGASKLKTILGYDRVMVYRFHQDGSGEVIAEKREPHLEPFLGLRYPRTDIPEQARQLYLRNRFRIIADVYSDPVEILPSPRFDDQPLDLSMSMLRAVSPIHIQYLKNMGVGASLSISIVHQGKLWGLFACHNYSAKPLPLQTRTTAELFSQLFSIALDRSLVRTQERRRDKGQRMHDLFMTKLVKGRSLIEGIETIDELIGETIQHDGLSVYAEGIYKSRGSAPTREEFEAILPALNAASPGKLIAQDALGAHISSARRFADRAAGALIIPMTRNPRDYLVLWRRELPQKVIWAGNPTKAIGKAQRKGEPLLPRSSFAAWEEQVTDRSESWEEADLQIAETLRTTLIEVVLRLTDETERERKKAQEQQSLLIAELNHRVRNILNLIRGLIDQSRHEALDIDQFTQIVGGRISALATAHENITRENWSPAPVSKLIEAEAQAYLNEKVDRLRVNGDDVLVTPQAYTVLALVLHEMVTNSAKYGSLCDRRGELDISLARSLDGDLVIDWKESGGPPVKEPTRRGFGSTIIERSIPFELNGYSKLEFKKAGLEARFRIPGSYIREPEPDGAGGGANKAKVTLRANLPSDTGMPNHILLVEDSMIIALDTAETLRRLGVQQVTTCSNSLSALEAIETAKPDFAIVDFNLGSETSETVIQKLRKAKIPFLLATGYGDVTERAGELGAAGLLRKPYGQTELKEIVPDMQAAQGPLH